MASCDVFFGNKHTAIDSLADDISALEVSEALQFTKTQQDHLELIGLEPILADHKGTILFLSGTSSQVSGTISSNLLEEGGVYRLVAEDRRMGLLQNMSVAERDALTEEFHEMGASDKGLSPTVIMEYFRKQTERYLEACNAIFMKNSELHASVQKAIRETSARQIALILNQDIGNAGIITLDNFLAFKAGLETDKQTNSLASRRETKRVFANFANRPVSPSLIRLQSSRAALDANSRKSSSGLSTLQPISNRDSAAIMAKILHNKELLLRDQSTLNNVWDPRSDSLDPVQIDARPHQKGSVVELIYNAGAKALSPKVQDAEDASDDDSDLIAAGDDADSLETIVHAHPPTFVQSAHMIDGVKHKFVLHTSKGQFIKTVHLSLAKSRIALVSGSMLTKKKTIVPFGDIRRCDDGSLRDAMCFSIVTPSRTYNLQTSTARERNIWVAALNEIISMQPNTDSSRY